MIELYPVVGPWPGQLALCARPRGGSWLEDDVRSLKNRGIDVLVSAITANEVARLGLQELAYVCHMNGVRAVHFPVGNLLVPEREVALPALLGWIGDLDAGKGLALHCWATVGRSPMLAAGLLAISGIAPDVAWQRVAEARGRDVPDTIQQREWVWELARNADVATQQTVLHDESRGKA